MALSTSAGSEVRRRLASVVIGGLVSAMLLTLLVLPTVYTWLEEWIASRHSARVGSPEDLAVTGILSALERARS